MSRRDKLLKLRNPTDPRPLVLPSLLLCDFGDLKTELCQLEQAGVEALHLDVMDGVFVPNLSYGLPVVKGIRDHTELPLDVHLMIAHPEQYLTQFSEAGADLLTVHVEACDSPVEVVQEIRSLGMGSGITLNPRTPVTEIEDALEFCDLVLVMSVEAGFGGQAFDPVALEKLEQLVQLREERSLDFILEVDGGINRETIGRCRQSGATWMVVGSGIFRQPSYTAAMIELNDLGSL
jgi:ribulose-phosphate 3-epimerase